MKNLKHSLGAIAAGLIFVVSGCAHTRDVHQFSAVPEAKVGAQELTPVTKPNSTTELLRTADEAFRRGNEAQERGDKAGALREYNRFLELLIQADLDPTVFYNLRSEFGRVLDSSSEQAQLFERIKKHTLTSEEMAQANVVGDFDIELNDRVIREIEEIQNYYPRNFQAGLSRSGKYVPYIRSEFTKAGLPADLAWLAMVESQFTPKIVSRAGAGGMWQFMRDTARRYNLRIDNYVDERYNWEKCTQAAIMYLTELRDRFQGNWPVAIASYNMGEYGMERAIASNGGETNLWKLIETGPASNRMQEETKKFYPKLLASIIVAGHPEKYGFENNRQAPDDYVRVPINGMYSLAVLDRASGLPEGTLSSLNKELIRNVTPPNGEFMLAVPTPARDQLIAALSKVPQERGGGRFAVASLGKGGLAQHIVRRGETLSEIADKYEVSLNDLMKVNRIRSASSITIGKRLTIPRTAEDGPDQQNAGSTRAAAAASDDTKRAQGASSAKSTSGDARTYKVKPGDTLFDIAKLENSSIEDLQKLNNMGNSTSLRVGDTLVLSPGDATASPSVEESPQIDHVVKGGESPYIIARKYRVSLDDLLKWNRLTKRSSIKVGDRLVVYRGNTGPDPTKVAKVVSEQVPPARAATAETAATPAKTSAAPEAATTMHKVVKGESPASIAAKYGVALDDFLSWNGLKSSSVIKVGEEYKVSAGQAPVATAPVEVASAKEVPAPTEARKSAPATKGNKLTHTVANGDSPSGIAAKYAVRLDDFLSWNGLSRSSVIHVGDQYTVYASEAKSASAPAAAASAGAAPAGEKVTHTVSQGQNPTTIARRYGVKVSDLFAWNGWTKDPRLKIGDKVVVCTKK